MGVEGGRSKTSPSTYASLFAFNNAGRIQYSWDNSGSKFPLCNHVVKSNIFLYSKKINQYQMKAIKLDKKILILFLKLDQKHNRVVSEILQSFLPQLLEYSHVSFCQL